jgi:hypothetical protein
MGRRKESKSAVKAVVAKSSKPTEKPKEKNRK